MSNYQVVRWRKDWSIPHRLLLKRKIILSKQNADPFDGNDGNDSICQYEWLVKWTGLGYDHVTWELDDASFMRSSKGMKLVENYESRQKRSVRLSNPFEANEVLLVFTKYIFILIFVHDIVIIFLEVLIFKLQV